MTFRSLLCVLAVFCASAQAAPRLDAAEVATWADATFTQAFNDRRFSGLVISVVQDDAVLFTKGYGYADYARQTPIDPDKTRFRIGSITKTFTALAIAQLVEQGAIHSIDDPVNRYLKRDQLPQGFGKDITLRHLLTHTGGFSSNALGLATDQTFALPLTAGQVRAERPPIVREPGGRSVYSNYGTALLAVIVEDITGVPIEQYFRERLFGPLGMTQSSLNVTPRPTPNLAQPYRFFPNGDAQAQRFFGVHPFFAPVGAVESTASDMARYMIANLQAGQGDSAKVLGPAQFAALHERIAGNHPLSSGFGMIFITADWNGVRFFGHGGDWPGFHSIMLMSPDSRAGFFISCLCEAPSPSLKESLFGSPRMRENPAKPVLPAMTNIGVTSAFLDRFWGARHFPASVPTGDLAKYEGVYWHEFRNYDSAEKLLELLGGDSATLLVQSSSNDSLSINGTPYAESAPGVFWNAKAEPTLDGQFWDSGLWAFSLDGDGKPLHASPTFGIDPYVRAGNYANPRFASKVMALCALFSLTGLLAAFWPRGRGPGRIAKWLPLTVPACVIGMGLSLLAGFPEGDGLGTALLLGERTRFNAVTALAILTAVITALMVITSVLAWRDHYWGDGKRAIARRIHFTMLTIAALGLCGVFAFANLL